VVERDGRLASANDAALTQYGYALDALCQLSIDDLLAVPRTELLDDLEHAYLGDRRPLARRPHRRKDGSVLWVVPAAGPQSLLGETFIVSALQDVTALVSAEERAAFERSRSELLWEGAVERLGSAVALFDADRRIVRMSRIFVEWMKQPEAELTGKRCDELFLRLCATQPWSSRSTRRAGGRSAWRCSPPRRTTRGWRRCTSATISARSARCARAWWRPIASRAWVGWRRAWPTR
jgi:PAS domain S-box-containing protein